MASKAYAAPKFPRELMRDCVSVREGMLMHNKLLLVRTVPSAYAVKDEDGEEADVPHAWAYVGSANFSKNAWGNLMREKGAEWGRRISVLAIGSVASWCRFRESEWRDWRLGLRYR